MIGPNQLPNSLGWGELFITTLSADKFITLYHRRDCLIFVFESWSLLHTQMNILNISTRRISVALVTLQTQRFQSNQDSTFKSNDNIIGLNVKTRYSATAEDYCLIKKYKLQLRATVLRTLNTCEQLSSPIKHKNLRCILYTLRSIFIKWYKIDIKWVSYVSTEKNKQTKKHSTLGSLYLQVVQR